MNSNTQTYSYSELSDHSPIFGLVDGIEYKQQERVEDLNERIYSRLYSDSPLRPHFNPRPVMTKYSQFPILDRRVESKVPINTYLDYTVGTASIVGPAPIEGFQNNIGVESELRNQLYALSSAPQRYYVPSSSSDLYNVAPVAGSLNEAQPFPALFDDMISGIGGGAHPNISARPDVGAGAFFNSTRAQLRGLGDFVR